MAAIAALCCHIGAHAQISAAQVMSNTIKAINAAPSLQAQFTAITSDRSSASGTLVMRGDRFSMVTPDFGTWYDGSSMWSYYKKSGETSLTTPTDEELLEANPFFIVNNYLSYYKPRITKHAAGIYVIRLEPKSKNTTIKGADITIESSSWLPKAVKATFSNGSGISVDIKSMQVLSHPLPYSAFAYPASKYPGIEVIDLR